MESSKKSNKIVNDLTVINSKNIKKDQFIPVFLGSDRNAYGMAVAFYEEYGIRSVLLGKFGYVETKHSKIIDIYTNRDVERKEIFIKCLKDIYEKYKDFKLLLIGCSDIYVKLIIKNSLELKKYFIIPYVNEVLMNKLILKEEFYDLCDKYNLSYPKLVICTKEMYNEFVVPFDYPIIIKPSNSVEYWKSSFEGKKKIFISNDENETKDILNRIYNSTYKENLIIQEYIEGDDTNLRVLNAYVNQNHKVTFMGLGQVLLEEKTPQAIGDYGAIISTYDKKLFDKVQFFLEDIKYVGYANFDLKYDKKSGEYKFFEINLRQGRSSSFTTVSGKNLAKYLVDDFIYNKDSEIEYLDNEYLWTIVPKGLILKYLKNDKLKKKVRKLCRQGKVKNILLYSKDFSIKRYFMIKSKTFEFYKKYKKHYK